jgi:hypothetical protein
VTDVSSSWGKIPGREDIETSRFRFDLPEALMFFFLLRHSVSLPTGASGRLSSVTLPMVVTTTVYQLVRLGEIGLDYASSVQFCPPVIYT